MMSAGDLLACLRQRRSVRRFRPEPPPRQVLSQILEAARWAPSNHNRQAFRILVLDDQAEIAALAARIRAALEEKLQALPESLAAMRQLVEEAAWFGAAPVLLLVLHRRPPRVAERLLRGVAGCDLVSGEPLSAAMAVQNLLLMTSALGLGACVLTAPLFARETVAAVPGLPDGHDVTCFVALGYPDEVPEAPPRKPLDQLVDFRRTP